MKFRSIVAVFALALVLLLVSSAPATAQLTSSAPGTAPSLQAFNIERVIALNNILTTITPNIPANVLAALAGGALEIREVLAYNAQSQTLTSTVFGVPTGSPIPTPVSVLANLGNALVEQSTTTVDKVYVTATPFMSVTFVGKVTQSTPTPYGPYLGAVSTLSVGFTSDTPPKVTTVVESVSGALVAYSAAATVNAFAVTIPSTGGGGGMSSNPTVVIAPIINPVLVKEVTLDASKSTDPNGLALTYLWSQPGGQNSALINVNSPVAIAQLGNNGPATYTFMVKVTDSAGNSATGMVTVNFQ